MYRVRPGRTCESVEFGEPNSKVTVSNLKRNVQQRRFVGCIMYARGAGEESTMDITGGEDS